MPLLVILNHAVCRGYFMFERMVCRFVNWKGCGRRRYYRFICLKDWCDGRKPLDVFSQERDSNLWLSEYQSEVLTIRLKLWPSLEETAECYSAGFPTPRLRSTLVRRGGGGVHSGRKLGEPAALQEEGGWSPRRNKTIAALIRRHTPCVLFRQCHSRVTTFLLQYSAPSNEYLGIPLYRTTCSGRAQTLMIAKEHCLVVYLLSFEDGRILNSVIHTACRKVRRHRMLLCSDRTGHRI